MRTNYTMSSSNDWVTLLHNIRLRPSYAPAWRVSIPRELNPPQFLPQEPGTQKVVSERVQNALVSAHTFLRSTCRWGGSDKSWHESESDLVFLGYEFRTFKEAAKAYINVAQIFLDALNQEE